MSENSGDYSNLAAAIEHSEKAVRTLGRLSNFRRGRIHTAAAIVYRVLAIEL